MAEARVALQYLERAESWAAGVDEEILTAMVVIHRRLLDKMADMARADNRYDPPFPSHRSGQHSPQQSWSG